MLDEEAAELLDEQSGKLNSGAHKVGEKRKSTCGYHGGGPDEVTRSVEASSGGASRFFYCTKASKKDKGEGNTHPTPKNTKLMRWLVKLITPPGGIVLDPFAGSGSTGVACMREGFYFVGMEQSDEYAKIALARLSREDR